MKIEVHFNRVNEKLTKMSAEHASVVVSIVLSVPSMQSLTNCFIISLNVDLF